ncbi:MAG TPA: hypothetical protein VHF91_00610 [Acidimicrobiales bacterium]|nr:hypothetical protein [Acidimicrobiales bacterium]
MLRRGVGVVALLLAAVACGGSGDGNPDTVTVDGQPVAVAPLVDAHAGLCEAADRIAEARALFFDRSHEALHTVARALEDVDRTQAAHLLQAKERVESELAAPGPSLSGDLSRLADVYRASLGRLAIDAPPCD